MRQQGTGSVSRRAHGRFLVQLWVGETKADRRRVSLGLYATEDEANAVLDSARYRVTSGTRDGVTVEQWAAITFDRRELQGLRAVDKERSSWNTHGTGSELGGLPIREVTHADVQRWLDRVQSKLAQGPRGGAIVSRQTVQNALTVLRSVFADARQRGVIPSNPAADVELPRARGRTREVWTYLTPEEQTRLVKAAPEYARPLIAFAIGSGLRQGEQWALELADVHVDDESPHVIVRFGSPGKPTKSGKPRRVDLVPVALHAVEEQLRLLAQQELAARKRTRGYRDPNPHRVLFPSLRGTRRHAGAPKWWEDWCEAAKLGRTVRWHDLRHTCASSLIAGWWGRAWSLVEVCALLGHSTIKVTERYAHMAGTIVESAAAETRRATGEQTMNRENQRKPGSHLRGLNSRPTVYETDGQVSEVGEMSAKRATAVAESAPGLAKVIRGQSALLDLGSGWAGVEDAVAAMAGGER